MEAIKRVTYIHPSDNIERPVGFGMGARRRIIDRFKMSWNQAISLYGDACLPELLYCCMYDGEGNPPNLPIGTMTEQVYTIEELREMYVTLMAAISNGRQEKKEIAALMDKAAALASQLRTKTNGLASGHSPVSTSELPGAPRPAAAILETSGS